ncbi:hypothetical protein GCM10027282_12960 [Frigoribacterium salinisoli]
MPMTLDAPSTAGPLNAANLPKKKRRQIFVAYPYRIYAKEDYRKVYQDLAKAFNVKFIFADEQISSLTVLDKIRNYIEQSEFGIYDISGWNPNVTLELGLAFGAAERAYIAFDPSKTNENEVPTDLRGIDRIQYSSFHTLGEGLAKLLAQEMPVPTTHDAENQLDELRRQALTLLSTEDGLKIEDVATLLGVTKPLAQLVVKPLVNNGLRTEGKTKGTKYFTVTSETTRAPLTTDG